MQFNVAGLLKAPIGARREYDLSEDLGGLGPDVIAVEPLTGKLRLTRTASGVLATGKMHTSIRIDCRRCMQEFTSPVDIEIEEEFMPTIDILTGSSIPVEEVEEALRIDERHILDITEVVRQYILLQREQYPLCDEACAGLCPVCGKNLNEGPCGCEDTSGDPRWSALRELLG